MCTCVHFPPLFNNDYYPKIDKTLEISTVEERHKRLKWHQLKSEPERTECLLPTVVCYLKRKKEHRQMANEGFMGEKTRQQELDHLIYTVYT